MNKLMKKIYQDWQVYFCYLLILCGILFAIAIAIFKPMKINTDYYYEYKNKITLEEMKFPVEQHIRFRNDNLYVLNIYFNDMSINDYSYSVGLFDEDGNEYFSNNFSSHKESGISIYIDKLGLKRDYDYILKIDCPECNDDVKMSVKNASDNFNYLSGFDNKSLEITVNYFSRNYGFYWYSAMAIVIGLTLLPTVKCNKSRGKK